ncbi:SRPBCC family protein [Streptomyces spongiae]|uniref:Carbon monoxide dehydrogenase subunit G n=1 Tax=Streptomyces spongiae TaxID=565072 RepID=A0A5N8XW51_9ACTN|nr:SRPBCC family protein [Streptomyces spongiae]MPY63298.1 carbon monoxide dehydrogenase subunit G [Streptomyces spongiae]
MEHEVFVPVPVERLGAALSDPERVARAVPGLQQDAGTAPVAGRLKVRVSGHTITYRGALRVSRHDDGSFAIEGDATEARGSGSVKLALSVRLDPAEGGTTVTFGGTATADGRIEELDDDAVSGAVTRLLTRFAENLGEPVEEPESSEAAPPVPEAEEEDAVPSEEDVVAEGFADGADELDGADESDGADEVDEGEPPAEAAHARRTMIGRSAEEVDHAPPRGRYAPVPVPESVVTGPTLRWAAPAAALALASAVVVVRALRRRRA